MPMCALTVDVGDEEQVVAAVREAVARLGGLMSRWSTPGSAEWAPSST